MKIAIVHDYIKEYGGAERVLKTLSDMYLEAPIYTAFRVKDSTADKEFEGRKIIESSLSPILKIRKLYSPLRFLIPIIWGRFDLSKYDLVITSCSWYVTRGFKVGKDTKVIAYCHTPPRWLYGYETSVSFTKYWPVKIYAAIVGHFMRMYDFNTAQKINHWIANSKNVANRIWKYYRKESTVIYPPIETKEIKKITKGVQKKDFYLIVSRLVGAKGIEHAVNIAQKLKINLIIVGESHGLSNIQSNLQRNNQNNIENAKHGIYTNTSFDSMSKGNITKYFINAAGKFIKGGPPADTGLTGRKIIVDTYGGHGSHGGGCFSGKDPSKVDRSASYLARYIAKNIVAAGLADKCEVQLSYVIGRAEPVSVLVQTFGTGKIEDSKMEKIVRKHFPLKPAQIIRQLKLKRPIYKQTAAYGHFGRNEESFTWEKTDKVNVLRRYL